MESRPPPRVLLIDLGGVVIRDPRPTVVRSIVRRESLDPDRFREAYYRACRRLAVGATDLPRTYSSLSRAFHLSMTYGEFRELVTARSLVMMPRVASALRRVHRSGTVRVVFASNIERAVWKGLCRKFGLEEVADGAALSFRLGVLKPQPAFFRKALREAHAAASEAFFVDDLAENVAGARAVGIPSRRVRSPEETLSVLRGLAGPAESP